MLWNYISNIWLAMAWVVCLWMYFMQTCSTRRRPPPTTAAVNVWGALAGGTAPHLAPPKNYHSRAPAGGYLLINSNPPLLLPLYSSSLLLQGSQLCPQQPLDCLQSLPCLRLGEAKTLSSLAFSSHGSSNNNNNNNSSSSSRVAPNDGQCAACVRHWLTLAARPGAEQRHDRRLQRDLVLSSSMKAISTCAYEQLVFVCHDLRHGFVKIIKFSR